MASQDRRPPMGNEHFRPQSVPLLERRNDRDGLHNHDDDLERANRRPSEDISRQSSFDLNDASFEQIPSQSGSPWTSKLRKYVSSFSRSTEGWKSRSKPSIRARSRSCRVAFYCIAITFMMLSDSPPYCSHSYEVLILFAQRCYSIHFSIIPYIGCHLSRSSGLLFRPLG